MGTSGESNGARLQGEMLVLWNERKQKFETICQWVVRDATGGLLEVHGRGTTGHLEDDEWLERNVTRRARALFAETRAYTEEIRDGVQRLL